MCINNRHIPMVVGQHDVAPVVSRFPVENYSPAVVFCAPEYAAGGVVGLVGRLADVAKVCHSIIRAVTVDMVNLIGLLSMKKEPRKPVGKVCATLVGHPKVSIAQFKPAGADSAALDSLDSANDSGFGVVCKVIANRIRDNFSNHGVLPHVVARGSVVGATDAPILSQVLLQPGAKSGEPAGQPPFSNTLTTLLGTENVWRN